MSDLISRSRAIENIWDVFNSYANDSQRFDEYETEAINNAFIVLQKTIEGQLTAYDVEKVVAELEEMQVKAEKDMQLSDNVAEVNAYGGMMLAYGLAIPIVEKGGVE